MKKILFAALLALFAFTACEKNHPQELEGTTWSGTQTTTGSYQGRTAAVGLDITVKFMPECQGEMSVHYFSKLGEQVVEEATHDFSTTYTFDGRNGVIKTIPSENDVEQRIMFHKRGSDTIIFVYPYNSLQYDMVLTR